MMHHFWWVVQLYPRANHLISKDIENVILSEVSGKKPKKIYYINGDRKKTALTEPTRVRYPIDQVSDSLSLRQRIAQMYSGVNSEYKQISSEKNLVAYHNTTEEKLAEGLKLGGIPVPSIAITVE